MHLNGPPDTLAIAGVAARLFGSTVVYDMHDSAPELFEAKFGGEPGGSRAAGAQRAAVACADEVIVTNETQRELAIARPGAPRPRVTVVRNGPRAREFPSPPPARPGELDAPRLVYVGTLDSQDGVLELPEILAAPALGGGPPDGRRGRARTGRAARPLPAGRVSPTGSRSPGTFPTSVWRELIADADIGLDPPPAASSTTARR